MPKKYNLSEFIERRVEEDGIEIELSDGTSVTIPPAELWPDEAAAAIDANDDEALARAIMGDEAFDRFRADGGGWRLLNAFIRDAKGVDAGE